MRQCWNIWKVPLVCQQKHVLQLDLEQQYVMLPYLGQNSIEWCLLGIYVDPCRVGKAFDRNFEVAEGITWWCWQACTLFVENVLFFKGIGLGVFLCPCFFLPLWGCQQPAYSLLTLDISWCCAWLPHHFPPHKAFSFHFLFPPSHLQRLKSGILEQHPVLTLFLNGR